ncbi:hypothetical protein JM654_15430 [Microbacterium oxydans]|nr:hypothetical protein [Microbacterium oxydans]
MEDGTEGGEDAVDDDVGIAFADVERVEPDRCFRLGGVEDDDLPCRCGRCRIEDAIHQLLLRFDDAAGASRCDVGEDQVLEQCRLS